MTSTDKLTPRVRYAMIMPDYGGAYGWINRTGDDTLGPNHADNSAWSGDHSISDELHADFVAWQLEFERANPDDHGCGLDLDWDSFHERGIQLTRRLKVELGDAARVFYVKPVEDPNSPDLRRREVLLDGTLVEQPSPWPPPPFDWLPRTIVSGGQTGVDRAALDWASSYRIAHGGWCPKGRLAADGPLALYYQLRETESRGYRQRTRLNVQDSDATLVFNTGAVDGGTLQTIRFAQAMGKPHRIFQLDGRERSEIAFEVVAWLKEGKFATLNIAGPREEKRPGIYELVNSTLDLCLTAGGTEALIASACADDIDAMRRHP